MMDKQLSAADVTAWYENKCLEQCLSFGLGGTRYMCQQAFYWQLCHLAAWCTHDIILKISGKHNNSIIRANWHIFPGMQSSQPVTVMSCCLNGNQSEKGWKTPATLGYGYGQPHVLQHVAFITLIIKYLPHMLLLATCFMMSLKVYKLKCVVVYPPARETFPKVLQILKLQLFITFCLNDVTVTRLEEEQQRSSQEYLLNVFSMFMFPCYMLACRTAAQASYHPSFLCFLCQSSWFQMNLISFVMVSVYRSVSFLSSCISPHTDCRPAS